MTELCTGVSITGIFAIDHYKATSTCMKLALLLPATVCLMEQHGDMPSSTTLFVLEVRWPLGLNMQCAFSNSFGFSSKLLQALNVPLKQFSSTALLMPKMPWSAHHLFSRSSGDLIKNSPSLPTHFQFLNSRITAMQVISPNSRLHHSFT